MSARLGTVLVGGGSGFVGSAIRSMLSDCGYNVVTVSRSASGPRRVTWDDLAYRGLPEECQAVVNVAGQNVLDPTRRWTAEFRETVRASRVDTTKTLAKLIGRAKTLPRVFVTISGVGFYPASSTAQYTEDSPGGHGDFFAQLASEWEQATTTEVPNDVRRVVIRSGVVLGREGGMVQQLIWPFFLGLGGPVASGTQYMPWIHVEDLARLFVHAVQEERVAGVLNGVAPDPVTNGEFARCFAKHLRRPSIIPLPAAVVRLIFGRERASILTEGQWVVPKRTLESGFRFRYPDLDSACRECAQLIYVDRKLGR